MIFIPYDQLLSYLLLITNWLSNYLCDLTDFALCDSAVTLLGPVRVPDALQAADDDGDILQLD